jgi:hypothetical protein
VAAWRAILRGSLAAAATFAGVPLVLGAGLMLLTGEVVLALAYAWMVLAIWGLVCLAAALLSATLVFLGARLLRVRLAEVSQVRLMLMGGACAVGLALLASWATDGQFPLIMAVVAVPAGVCGSVVAQRELRRAAS